jgi:dihydrofolate reductase
MGKLVVSEFISIDGVIEDPGGAEGFERGGWAFESDQGEDGARFKFEELMAAGSLLLGRVTYEGFAKAWPTMEGTGEFGERMNGMPKHVVSSSRQKLDWSNSHRIEGDLAEAVRELREAPGGDVLVTGSAQLVQALAGNDLVDEYRLMVFPTVLGAGKRLFAGTSSATTMALVESRPVGNDGVLVLTYRPKLSGAVAEGEKY